MEQIQCGTIWGGIRNNDVDVSTGALTASLFSSAANGGKGGDIYYFSVCGHDILTRIAIADVVGHGHEVSDISQWLYNGLLEYMHNLNGHEILNHLNQRASERDFDAITTATMAGFFKTDSKLYFSYAGHPPILIKRVNDSAWQCLEQMSDQQGEPIANLPLGVEPATHYGQGVLSLEQGDRLLFYTDGVIEAPAQDDHKLFGEVRLREVLTELGNVPLEMIKHKVVDALRQHTGGELTHDDVTLLAVEVT